MLPIPGSPTGPRPAAIAAVADELTRLGVRNVTILVAGGLLRRTAPREIASLVTPEFRRRFRGRLIVHDMEADDLVGSDELGEIPLRVNRALVETDLVVTVTAAETVLHGGPAALLGATGRRVAARGRGAVAARDRARPRAGGSHATSSSDSRSASGSTASRSSSTPAAHRAVRPAIRTTRSRSTGCSGRVCGASSQRAPGGLRQAGPRAHPARAHGGRRLRRHGRRSLTPRRCSAARCSRASRCASRVDAIVIGVPPTTPFLPRERPNPVSAAYLGLGLALRLWRDAPPVVAGGTAILVHPFQRRFPRPTQTPYRALFFEPRPTADALSLAEAERAAIGDETAIAEYRAGRALHPLQPFAEWRACAATSERLGAVLIAGCRDAQAARQLGFVGVHGLGAALEMAKGRGAERIGYLLSPPYFPLVVG